MNMINFSLDPTGNGMFSKAGRFTSEKYSVFRKKDEILENKPKYLKVSHFPTFEMAWNDDSDKSQDEINQKLAVNYEDEDLEEPTVPLKTTFDKYTGRYEHYLAKQNERLKHLAPPLGQYYPKTVDKHKKVLPNYSTEIKLRPHMNRFTMVDQKWLDEFKDIEIQMGDGKLRKHEPAPVDFEKQRNRPDMRDTLGTRFVNRYGYNEHEEMQRSNRSQISDEDEKNINGFLNTDTNSNMGHMQSNMGVTKQMTRGGSMSKSQNVFFNSTHSGTTDNKWLKRTRGHLSIIPFNRYPDRKELFVDEVATKTDASYHPRYSCVKSRLDTLCVPWDKASVRVTAPGGKEPKKGLEGMKVLSTINVEQHKIGNKKNNSMIRTSSFKKSLDRCPNPNGLPLFMQKKNASRFAINTFSEKAFELNNYADRDFLKNYTSFKIKKRAVPKRKTIVFDEDLEEILKM